jgi:hypothetical protein
MATDFAIRRARVSGALASSTRRTCQDLSLFESRSNVASAAGSADSAAAKSSGTATVRGAVSSAIVPAELAVYLDHRSTLRFRLDHSLPAAALATALRQKAGTL